MIDFDLKHLKTTSRVIKDIIIHCTATPEGREVSVADIDRWHKERGFSGIGYHFVIDLQGKVHRGRSVNLAGAHCVGKNSRSIGVVYVGGLDANGKAKDTRTLAQRVAMGELLRELRKLYPWAKISGHRDWANKDCPCFDATKEFANI